MQDDKINARDFSQFIKAYGKSRAKSLNIASDTYVQYAMTVTSNRAMLAAELLTEELFSTDFAYSTAAMLTSSAAPAAAVLSYDSQPFMQPVSITQLSQTDAAIVDMFVNDVDDAWENILAEESEEFIFTKVRSGRIPRRTGLSGSPLSSFSAPLETPIRQFLT